MASKRGGASGGGEQASGAPTSVPRQFPETTPPAYPSNDFSWPVQGIYELKGSVSKLEAIVQELKECVGRQRDELKTIHRTLNIATGAVIAVGAILSFFLAKAWDTLTKLAELVRHLPAQ